MIKHKEKMQMNNKLSSNEKDLSQHKNEVITKGRNDR